MAATYDGWQFALVAAAIVAGIAAIVIAVATYQTSHAIPKLADERSLKLDADLMQQPESAWPTRLLLANGWANEKAIDDLTILVEHPSEDAIGPQPTGILVRRGEQTLVWAKAVPFGERYVWPYAQVSDQLEDGDNSVSISQVVAGTGIADFIRQTENYPVDIVGVGLESSHGGDAADIYRKLSDDRGVSLVEAVSNSITVVNPQKLLRYRTIGIGRALTKAEKGSNAERRQRSALVIVIARMSHDIINLPETNQLITLLMDVDLKAIDLTDYEYSAIAARRLSVPLVFGDSDAEPWVVPPISAADALAARAALEGAN
ncbi:MAG: hypothetical protein Q8R02_20275 [Hyphomonadaceae bacterium]|nr:hypothetical protein [Hyphomonadaceae bacterium]